MIPDKGARRRRKAVLGRREPWSHAQLVEELRQVIGMALAAFTATRLLERHGARKLARVWAVIADEIIGESLPDVQVHRVALGVDRRVAFDEAVVAVVRNEGIMIGHGMEIASGTIAGVRCLLPVADLDEFWARIRLTARIVADVSPDSLEGRAPDARPSWRRAP